MSCVPTCFIQVLNHFLRQVRKGCPEAFTYAHPGVYSNLGVHQLVVTLHLLHVINQRMGCLKWTGWQEAETLSPPWSFESTRGLLVPRDRCRPDCGR